MKHFNANELGRQKLAHWQQAIRQNNYQIDLDFQHNIAFYLTENFQRLNPELNSYAEQVASKLEPTTQEGQRLEAHLHENLGVAVARSVIFETTGEEIVAISVAAGGALSGEHGIGLEKRDYMPLMFGPDDLAAQELLRDAFDPLHLANPSKVLPSPATCGDVHSVPEGAWI